MATDSKLELFLEGVKSDCGRNRNLFEAVSRAAMVLFEADGEDSPAETAETPEAPAEEAPATETPNPGTPSTPISGDAGDEAQEVPADGSAEQDAAQPDAAPAEPENAPEPQEINAEKREKPDLKKLVGDFVRSGAVRDAQEAMKQSGEGSLKDFERRIAAALAKFCVDNQIAALDTDTGVKISEALAIRFGRKRG